MPLNPFWQNNIDTLNNLPAVQEALQDLAPYFKGIQTSFGDSYAQFYYLIPILIAMIGLLWLVNTLVKHKPLASTPTTSSDPGDDLFQSLLDQLDINTADRNLLQQIARDTRLRHPSVFLLSPDMLDWSKQIWVQEKGFEQVTDRQKKQIDQISYKLFGPSRSLSHARTQHETAGLSVGSSG